MESIKNAINHLCHNIQNGGTGQGWTAEEIEKLSNGVLLLAKAEAALNPKTAAPDLLSAAHVIREHCQATQYCADCPLGLICDAEAPHQWKLAPEGSDA